MKNDITSHRTMYDVLRSPDRLQNEVKGVSGVLAHLWRKVLAERSIGLVQFDSLCAQYIIKARRQQTSSRIANYFNRSNIFREMSRPTMTFKVFVKAMQLIGMKRLRITIELEGRGFTTRHSTSIMLTGENGVDFEDLMEDGESREEKLEAPAQSGTAEGSAKPPS
jgi:hypothetical protein